MILLAITNLNLGNNFMSIFKAIIWFFVGIFLSVLVYFMAMGLLWIFFTLTRFNPSASSPIALLFGFVIWSVLYMVPVILWFKQQQRYDAMSGSIIGVVVLTVLTVYSLWW